MYHPNIRTSDRILENIKSWPTVVKVGTVHSGCGKMKINGEDDFEDFTSTLLLYKDYFTTEPFIKDVEYDLRLQKIGDSYRVYTRSSSSGWKNNW